MNKQQILSVKELTNHIKGCIENDPVLAQVWVRAEISNFVHHSRGHMYFTLKDDSSRIKAVMFAGHNRYLKFLPKNGMKVIVRGEVNVYERDGQYQLYVKDMEPDGIGALYQAFEELKEKLQRNGWFDPERKKAIPRVPKRIGVITSPTGAAIRDILTTLKRRFPVAEVIVFPVLVQGEFAPSSISQAIRMAHDHELEVLIVGRGGGSIEELWAFNEEMVAQAIYESTIPIISAVGHETDYTISDFVADLRAPTPTAAAELAVPLLQEMNGRLQQLEGMMQRGLQRTLNQRRRELLQLQNRYAFKVPMQIVRQKEQELDHALMRLGKGMNQLLQQHKLIIQQSRRQLLQTNLSYRIQQQKERIDRLTGGLAKGMQRILEKKREQTQFVMFQLDAFSPLKIMTKGYSLLYNHEKTVLYRSTKEIEPGQPLKVQMHDGELECQVWGIKEDQSNE
ncbi:exodeoxyribonuclease VII large subunit [Bacillus horti]|uniref:Exodeoxyribonuclease 7 large subunit n=1 Tax=Caldalkalibacillus horti TaxID=77523 RepID=A0ABT9W0T3_9BACI|nr:exodeoxyribonuclease VII large subunit [Bacillus horti]MDQ0166873.1 exodeoxyribonuclease VII large subunit [Bacillus horti]